MLTDEEITLIVRECAKGSAINRDGSTSHRIARAIIAAYEAKLREQNPVGYFCPEYMGGPVLYYQVQYSSKGDEGVVPLFEHPAPIPEGYVLVPIEPPCPC